MNGKHDWMEDMAQLAPEVPDEAALDRVSTCLKSRIYSALVQTASEQGPLVPLPETRAAGFGLCVFEQLVAITPTPSALQEFQYCRVCHARVLGERVEDAPIFWPNCPYSDFQKSN